MLLWPIETVRVRRLVEGDLPSTVLKCQRIDRLGSEGGTVKSRCACGKGDEARNERSFQSWFMNSPRM